MLAIRSHFFEFIEESTIESANPKVYVADELETGRSYYILFTTSGGLYRYNINDIVKVVGWHNNAPLLEFLHKGGNISSFTGEKITESQVTKAVLSTAQELNRKVRFFTVVPVFRPEPHYELLVEFSEQSGGTAQSSEHEMRERFSATADRFLGEENIEYLAKRQSMRLTGLEVKALAEGTYENIRKALVANGTPDAQIKISHLNPKKDILALIEKFQSPELLSAT
jgi:hypothetical protein